MNVAGSLKKLDEVVSNAGGFDSFFKSSAQIRMENSPLYQEILKMVVAKTTKRFSSS